MDPKVPLIGISLVSFIIVLLLGYMLAQYVQLPYLSKKHS